MCQGKEASPVTSLCMFPRLLCSPRSGVQQTAYTTTAPSTATLKSSPQHQAAHLPSTADSSPRASFQAQSMVLEAQCGSMWIITP